MSTKKRKFGFDNLDEVNSFLQLLCRSPMLSADGFLHKVYRKVFLIKKRGETSYSVCFIRTKGYYKGSIGTIYPTDIYSIRDAEEMINNLDIRRFLQ